MSRRFRALALAAAPLPLLAAAALAGTATAQTQPLVSVPGNTSPALSHSERHGAVDADAKLSVSVSLKLRNSSELDKLIADTMGVSIHTVRSYVRRTYEKLQVHSRTEAVAKYRSV